MALAVPRIRAAHLAVADTRVAAPEELAARRAYTRSAPGHLAVAERRQAPLAGLAAGLAAVLARVEEMEAVLDIAVTFVLDSLLTKC